MIPITLAEKNKKHIIQRVAGNKKIKQHLEDLGLIVDTEVEILSELNGSVILKVNETRLALNEELARKLYV